MAFVLSALCTALSRRRNRRFSGPTKCWNQHCLESRLWRFGLAFGGVHSDVFVYRLASPPWLGSRLQCHCEVACLRGRDSTFLQSHRNCSLPKCLLLPAATSAAVAPASGKFKRHIDGKWCILLRRGLLDAAVPFQRWVGQLGHGLGGGLRFRSGRVSEGHSVGTSMSASLKESVHVVRPRPVAPRRCQGDIGARRCVARM